MLMGDLLKAELHNKSKDIFDFMEQKEEDKQKDKCTKTVKHLILNSPHVQTYKLNDIF